VDWQRFRRAVHHEATNQSTIAADALEMNASARGMMIGVRDLRLAQTADRSRSHRLYQSRVRLIARSPLTR